MNLKFIFKLFSLKGKGQTVAFRQITTLAASLTVLSLFVLTACLQVPASVPVGEEISPAVVPQAVIGKEPVSDSAFLAANPELLKARPSLVAAEMTGSALMAANPELAIVGRYADLAEQRAKAAELVANPELLKAHPPTRVEEVSESTYLASNPELKIVRRYPVAIENESSQSAPSDIEAVMEEAQLHHPGR